MTGETPPVRATPLSFATNVQRAVCFRALNTQSNCAIYIYRQHLNARTQGRRKTISKHVVQLIYNSVYVYMLFVVAARAVPSTHYVLLVASPGAACGQSHVHVASSRVLPAKRLSTLADKHIFARTAAPRAEDTQSLRVWRSGAPRHTYIHSSIGVSARSWWRRPNGSNRVQHIGRQSSARWMANDRIGIYHAICFGFFFLLCGLFCGRVG